MKSVLRANAVAMLIGIAIAMPTSAQPSQPDACAGKSGFALRACQAEAGKKPSLPSPADLKKAALTTSFKDTIHLEVTEPPAILPRIFQRLTDLDRMDDGSFILTAGAFEVAADSWPLDLWLGPDAVGGLRPAPIKGQRAPALRSALKECELHPEVRPTDFQAFLITLVKGTNLEDMTPAVRNTAATILPPKVLATLKTSLFETAARRIPWLSPGPNPPSGPRAPTPRPRPQPKPAPDDREEQIKGTVIDIGRSKLDSSDLPVPRGAWAELPNHVFVRYMLESATKTRVQVFVSQAVFEAETINWPLTIDPTEYLALAAGTPIQRLGITLPAAR